MGESNKSTVHENVNMSDLNQMVFGSAYMKSFNKRRFFKDLNSYNYSHLFH